MKISFFEIQGGFRMSRFAPAGGPMFYLPVVDSHIDHL